MSKMKEMWAIFLECLGLIWGGLTAKPQPTLIVVVRSKRQLLHLVDDGRIRNKRIHLEKMRGFLPSIIFQNCEISVAECDMYGLRMECGSIRYLKKCWLRDFHFDSVDMSKTSAQRGILLSGCFLNCNLQFESDVLDIDIMGETVVKTSGKDVPIQMSDAQWLARMSALPMRD